MLVPTFFYLNNNTNIFCKDDIKKMVKDLPEGYNTLLNINPMVPGDRTLLAIGYNFNFGGSSFLLLKR